MDVCDDLEAKKTPRIVLLRPAWTLLGSYPFPDSVNRVCFLKSRG